MSVAGQRIYGDIIQRAKGKVDSASWREFSLALNRNEVPNPAEILRRQATWFGEIRLKPGDVFPVSSSDETGIGIVAEVREKYVRTETYSGVQVGIREAEGDIIYESNEVGYELKGEQVVFYWRQAKIRIDSATADDIPLERERPRPENVGPIAPGPDFVNGVPTSRQAVERLLATIRGLRKLEKSFLKLAKKQDFLGRELTVREKGLFRVAKWLLHSDEVIEALEEDSKAMPEGRLVFLKGRTLEALGKIGFEFLKGVSDSDLERKPKEWLRLNWLRYGLLPALGGFPDLAEAAGHHIGTGKLSIDSKAAEGYQDGVVASAEGVMTATKSFSPAWIYLDGAKEWIDATALWFAEGRGTPTPEVVTYFLDGANSLAWAALGGIVCEGNVRCALAVRSMMKEAGVQGRTLSEDWFRSNFAILSGRRDQVLEQWLQQQHLSWKHGAKLEGISKCGEEELRRLGFTKDLIECLDRAMEEGGDPYETVKRLCGVTACNVVEEEGAARHDSCFPPVGCPYEAAECPFWWPRPPFEPLVVNEWPKPPPLALAAGDDPGNDDSPPGASEAQVVFLKHLGSTLGLGQEETERRIKSSTESGASTNPAWVRFALEKTDLAVDFIALQRYLAGRRDSPGVLVSQ